MTPAARFVSRFLVIPAFATAIACSGTDGTDGSACDDADCIAPPASICSGDVLVEYTATGACGVDDACVYETISTPCAAGCSDGVCAQTAPCDGVACDAPPADTCDGDTLLTFNDAGTCDDATGECAYGMSEVDCTATDQQCRAGACVDVAGTCDGVTCDIPPDDTCNGDGAVVTYAAEGECNADTGECEYAETIITCDEGLVCSAGACVTEGGLCDGVVCNDAAPTCVDGEVFTATDGVCDEATGACVFTETSSPCDDGFACFDGACAEDTGLCDLVVCDPPAPTCDADGNVEFWASMCNPADGTCIDTPSPVPCDEGLVCSEGACVEPVDLCADVVCETAAPVCNEAGQVVTQTASVCDPIDGTCAVTEDVADCDTGFACFEGACVADAGLCADVTCDAPAATCDVDGNLVSWRSECDPADGACVDTSVIDACDAGLVCSEGACVEPVDLCADVVCETAAPVCNEAGQVITQTASVCDPADGTCAVTEDVTDCDTGFACFEGACAADTGLCVDVTCIAPAATCDVDGNRLSWRSECDPADGVCNDTPTTTACGTGTSCVEGECVPDPDLCMDVVCTPPAAYCDVDGALVTLTDGVCDPGDGSCSFVPTATACESGFSCFDGACVADTGLCTDVVCTPPGPVCDDGGNLVTSSGGICNPGTGVCVFTEDAVPCDPAFHCDVDACVPDADLCADVVCDPRAPFCDADGNPVTFSDGVCNPSSGTCDYSGTPGTCAGGSSCADGVCVVDLCADVTCGPTLAPSCDADGNRVTYGAGVCDPGTGDCDYPATATSCPMFDVCAFGSCVPDTPCATVICEPIAPYCNIDGDPVRTSNVCNPGSGLCEPSVTVITCDPTEMCFEGACATADSCTFVTCDTPPADFCNAAGDAVVHAATGTCTEPSLLCTYDPTVLDCAGATPLCLDGVCLGVPGAGDLIITEIMYDPTGIDDLLEWFEVYNASGRDLLLTGMEVVDGSDPTEAFTVGELVVASGAYAVFGQAATAAPQVDFDWGGVDSFILANTFDEIVLQIDGVEIDRVEYDERSTWPSPSNATISLDPAGLALNNNGDNWCYGVDEYDATLGSLGSPGAANAPCDFACFDVSCPSPVAACLDGTNVARTYTGAGTCESPAGTCNYAAVTVDTTCAERCLGGACVGTGATIAAGELVITEFLPNPAGTDTDYEWFEVINASDRALSLAGLRATSGPFDSFTVLDDISLAPGQRIAFVQSDLATPAAALTYNWGGEPVFLLANGGDELVLEWDGVIVDQITFDPTWPYGSGVAAAFGGDPATDDNALVANWCAAISSYDGFNLGTPAAANGTCEATGGAIDPGAIIFTEVMQNPLGDDALGEWFEIYNTTLTTLSLAGVTFFDNDGDTFTLPVDSTLEIGARDYLVLGNAATAAGGAVDYIYLGMSLGNGADELVMSSDGVEINRIEWDGGGFWPDPNGASMNLDGDSLSGSLNNDGNLWCAASALYDAENTGSPGMPNETCAGIP